MKKHKISLILATLGRIHEVENFIKCLIKQKYVWFELIIVDQNSHKHIFELFQKYKDNINIKYIHLRVRGLSKARNEGLKYATGGIIAFPDDDCEYPADLLDNIVAEFKKNSQLDFITCRLVDKGRRKDLYAQLPFSYYVTNKNIFHTCISATLFIKSKNKKHIRFDDRFGVGAKYGAAEEIDLVSRLIDLGYKGRYINTLFVYHPKFNETKERSYKYGVGVGAFFKKELLCGRKKVVFVYFYGYMIKGPLTELLININKGNKTELINICFTLYGRWKGFLQYPL